MPQELKFSKGNDHGDTLIEVAIGLSVLAVVLLSSLTTATKALRLGQTARERTEVSDQAQEQMEALRSFRDNTQLDPNAWDEFQNGNNCGGPGGYCGIDKVQTSPCQILPEDAGYSCFHMALLTSGTTTQWVPVPGPLTTSTTGSIQLIVPTSILEFHVSPDSAVGSPTTACDYNLELHYQFEPVGGGAPARNEIKTSLVNLQYQPAPGGCS